MIVLYNTNYTHNSNAYLTGSILAGAREVFGADDVVLADNHDLMRLAASGSISTLICIDGQRLRADILLRVRPSIDTMVLWLFEDPFMLSENLANAFLFDFIFTNDPACVAAYGGKARYLPLAASPSKDFRPVRADNELDFDIFFAGTMWPNRTILIERLIARFPDARIKLVCPTNEYLPPLPVTIAEHCIDRPVSHSSFTEFANRSKVVLTIFRDYTSGEGSGAATAPGPRYFELALSGTPQVISVDSRGSSDFFDTIPGNIIETADENVFAAIARLIEDPTERHRRALASQQAAFEHHLYEHRLTSIRNVLGSRQPSPPVAVRPKTRVVFCTHSVKTAAHIGGVEIYQDLLGSLLGPEFEVFYWVRTAEACALLDKSLETIEIFSAPHIGWLDVLSDPHEEALFSALLTSYGIDIVHIHHLGHHSASLPIIAKALGLGVVFSVHDYFLVCSRYNLLDFQQRFCNIASRSIIACDTCLKISENLPSGAQQTRRAFMSEVIDSVDTFLFGTPYSLEFLKKVYPRLRSDRCEVIGILNNPVESKPKVVPDDLVRRRFNVAVLGNVLRSKGADSLLRVIELLRHSDEYIFRIFGQAEEGFKGVLAGLDGASVSNMNGYSNGDIGRLPSCDVALFLSIWPETYSMSLSEAWQAGMIPIATNIGAFSDRITHGVNGFLVDIDDDSVVVALLQRLKDNPEICAEMRRAINPSLWPDRDAHLEQLRNIYRAHRPKAALAERPVKIDIGQIGFLPHFSWKLNAPPRHILEADPISGVSLSADLRGSELVESSPLSFIERIGERAWQEPVRIPRGERLPIAFDGWVFANEEALAGQVKVCLINDKQTIFIEADRRSRHDVCSIRPMAPEYSGFGAAASLPGRWSDGFYHLALLNTVATRCYVALTTIGLDLAGGAIVGSSFLPINEQHRKFVRARLRGEKGILPVAQDPLALAPAADKAEFMLEEVFILPSSRAGLFVRGWFFNKGLKSDAMAYLGWEIGSRVKYIAIDRQSRADVKNALGIDVLETGFSETIELPQDHGDMVLHVGWSDGLTSSRIAYNISLSRDATCEMSLVA